MKLGIVPRLIGVERLGALRLENRQADLEGEVGVRGTVDEVVASPGFHGGIKFVVQTVWPAGVLRIEERFVSASIGDENSYRGENRGRNWGGRHRFVFLCGVELGIRRRHR